MKTAAIGLLVAGLVSVVAADDPPAEPQQARSAPASQTIRSAVAINGKTVAPAHGSAAGIWFYTDGAKGAQLLFTGHLGLPESWRMTAVLNGGDEVRVSFVADGILQTDVQYRIEGLSRSALHCQTTTNVVIIKAIPGAGALRLTQFRIQGLPVSFAPERRPFSRDPVVSSPDPHPLIAEALVEWDWQMQDGIQTPREPRTCRQAVEKLLRQTDLLVTERRNWKTLASEEQSRWEDLRAASLAASNDDSAWESLWLKVHQLRRHIVLSNPLFTSSPLLFLKHVPSVMSHQLTQVYGYCARPGGGVFILSEPGVSMRTRDITPLPSGNFMTPELSYDAQRVLFAYCPVQEAPGSWDFNDQTKNRRYHIQELSLATGSVRTLTQGDTDNFSPVYLPSGEILFVSTRRGGFHRCGRGPCFVYTLSRMEADGQNPRSISFHETQEWDPCLLHDGRVVYTRWDYVDRNAVHYEQLWSARPDGSNVRVYYGNNTWNPTGIWEARAIPGSSRIMATAAPHHGMSAGSIILVDTTQAVDGKEPLTRLTPEVRFPESEAPLAFGPSPASSDFDTPVKQYWRSPLTESWMEATATEEEKRWPGHCYKSPWPLSEKFFIVSYSFDQLVGEPGPNIPNMFGLYLADAFGNKELLYRDPAISSLWARPLARRTVPPVVATPVAHSDKDTGTFFLKDVMESWPRLPTNTTITHLRIIQVLLKTTPHADSPKVGAAFAAPGKQVLGTVPVEADGSAFFEVPARTPMLFQALDAQGRAVQTMRSVVYLQPGENESCIGCHEHRMKKESSYAQAMATRRAPSAISPGPDGTRPFSYPRLVQPVLDRHCIKCHDGREPHRPVLTGAPEGAFTKSYNALVGRVSFSAWNRPHQNFEPLTEPMRFGALGSPLARTLEKAPCKVALLPEEQERLNTWMDANALFYGTFDVSEQAKQLTGRRIEGPTE